MPHKASADDLTDVTSLRELVRFGASATARSGAACSAEPFLPSVFGRPDPEPRCVLGSRYLDPALAARLASPFLTEPLRKCVAAAQKNGHHPASLGRYRNCVLRGPSRLSFQRGGQPYWNADLALMPCPTTELSSYVAGAFAEAMQCLGIDPLEMMPLFAQESRFHFNVINPAGAYGVGQMTAGTAKELNQRLARADHPDLVLAPALAAAQAPGCEQVRQVLTEPRRQILGGRTSGSMSSCELVRFDRVLTSFVYSGLLWLEGKFVARQALQPIVSKWPSPQRDNLERMVADAAAHYYNGGGPVWETLQNGLFSQMSGRSPLKLETYRRRLREVIGATHGREKRDYLLDLRNVAAQISKESGEQCGTADFGMGGATLHSLYPDFRPFDL